MVLIKLVDREDLEVLIHGTKPILEQLFYQVGKWKPTNVSNERHVWIRCSGILLHAWHNSFFEFITSDLGIFLTVDMDIMLKKKLGMA